MPERQEDRPLNGLSIPLHNIREFSGIFTPESERNASGAPLYGIGVARDTCDGFFVASTSHNTIEPAQVVRFGTSHEGMSDWIHFMRNSVPPKAVGIVCADLRFVEFLTEGHKPEVKENARPPLTDLPEEPRFFQFRPILTRMAAAYLSVLHGTTPDPNTVAAFLADVALDPLSHQFLTLTGMAHSAQDIIVFLKHNTGIDMVLAAFPAGTEMFTLSKTEATPADVDPAQMGLDYFSTESSFKELPKPYRVCFEPVGNGNPRSFGLYMIPERGGFPHDYQTTAL